MKCPTCESPNPAKHPAMQFEGEVQMCKDNFHYGAWLDEIAQQAMRSEWCIDPDDDYWRPKFLRGLDPQSALDELWNDVNPARQDAKADSEEKK